MSKKDEEVIISATDAKSLLDFLDCFDPHHFLVDNRIVLKLRRQA